MEGEDKMETLEKKDLGLKELSKKLQEFAESGWEINWEENPRPENLLHGMVEQVDQISEHFMWRGEVAKGLPNWNESEKKGLRTTLSDALLYLIRLADICGIDLADAATENIVNIPIRYPSKTI